jgi:hypothetical protein
MRGTATRLLLIIPARRRNLWVTDTLQRVPAARSMQPAMQRAASGGLRVFASACR